VPLIAVVLTVVVCLAVSTSLEAPGTISQLTVVNPSHWAARVAVASTPGGAAVPVGTVEAQADRAFQGVLDHSGTWVLKFSYLGVNEELAISRSDLAKAGWKVQIPDAFGARLQQAGTAPTP